jgi:hypothetical protein
MDKKQQQKPNSEAATCAVELDSLQTAFIWSLVILVSTVVFLFGVLVCNAAAETSRQRRRERNNNIYRNRSNLLLRQQQQQPPPPPTYNEALLHNLQNYQLSRIRPAGSNAAAAAAAAASESGAGVRERIQQHRVGIITSGNRIIRAESDTLLATVYATVPETAEQIKLQRKLLRSLQKFRFVIDSRPPSRARAAAARIPRIHISEQLQPQQRQQH